MFGDHPHCFLMSITWPCKPKKMTIEAGKCPTTPLSKLRPKGVFFPKTATGRKWNTCLKQWSLDCFQLILCFYLPDNIQTPPDTIQTPPDTTQTPPDTIQTPPDTPTHRRFTHQRSLEEQCNIWVLWPNMIFLDSQYTRQYPESPKHPADTFQTPSRHLTDIPKFSTFWLWEVTGRKDNSLIWRLLFNSLWFIWHLTPPNIC